MVTQLLATALLIPLEITIAHFKKIIALQSAGRRNPMTHENAEDLAANILVGRSVKHRSTIGFARHRSYGCTATVDKIAQPMSSLAWPREDSCRSNVHLWGKAGERSLHAALELVRTLASDRTGSASFFSLTEGASGGDVSALVAAKICCWQESPSAMIRSNVPRAQS